MKVVPQLLYQHSAVRKIMVDGLSCIVHKTLDTIDTETDHYVASHVISIVLKGKLKIKTFNEGERFVASENQVVFIPKGRYMISDVIPENDEFEAVFFFIESDLIQEFIKSIKIHFPKEEMPFSYVMKYTADLRLFCENILNLYQTNTNQYKVVTHLKLMELLYLLYYSDEKNNLIGILKSLQNFSKRNIKELMLLNFDKTLSIEDYAFLSGRSISTFRRDFKRQFHVSPKKWLISKRMEKAEILLVNSSLPIHEIAFDVGYDNVSHFIQSFKLYKNCTPKQFLIENRSNRQI